CSTPRPPMARRPERAGSRSPVAGGRPRGRHCRTRTTSSRCCAGLDVRKPREWEPRAVGADRTMLRLRRSCAWRGPSLEGRVRSRCRQLPGLNGDVTVLNLERIFEEPPLRRPGSARAVAIIGAAMAGTHEQAGLRKPANRAAQVGTVDGKHLELVALNTPHPARRVCGLTVRRRHIRIAERREPRFSFWKVADGPKPHPREIPVATTTRH